MNKNIRHNVGDRVMATRSSTSPYSQPAKEGEIYRVLDTTYCPKCGIQKINTCGRLKNVGELYPAETTICSDCKTLFANNGFHWTNSYLFVKPDHIESEIQEALENVILQQL